MTQEQLIRCLRSVGFGIFAKYYYLFRDMDSQLCISKLKSENDYTMKACATRTGHAKKIFRYHMEKQALGIIISSARTKDEDRKLAEKILSSNA